jgi:Domain of unknown function (DUF1707)
MTVEPGDETGAGRGRLRASHADREHVIDTLKAAFVQGRLTKDELDARVGHTIAARTYADLAAVTADLPAGLASRQPPRTPVRAQRQRPVVRPGPVIMGATACYAGVWALALLVPWPRGQDGDSSAAAGLVLIGTLVYLIVLITAVGHMIAARREKTSGGQLPPRRTQDGRALEGGRDHDRGDDLILCRVRSDARMRAWAVLPAPAP